MFRRLDSLFAALGLVLLAPAPGMAKEQKPRQPYEWVRTFEAVQSEIGRGSSAAHNLLPKLAAQIATEIENTEAEVMREPRNIRAILGYTLGGGDGRVLRKLLGLGSLTPVDEKIARGALAYAEGKFSEAFENLHDIDAKSLDASLAGRVALIQSKLIYKKDAKKSIALLDLARLLSAGTLVEEAALRLQVVLEATVQAHDRFEALSSRYFRKFRTSVYAGYFKEQFSVAAAGLDFSTHVSRLEKLKAVIDTLDESDQAALYILLAQKAIFLGNLPLTEFAAQIGEEKCKAQSREQTKAQLYRASAAIATGKADEAVSTLKNLETSALDPADSGLRQAALSVADEIMRIPDQNAAALEEEQIVPADQSSKPGPSEAAKGERQADQKAPDDPVVAKAKTVIAEVDNLLKSSRQ